MLRVLHIIVREDRDQIGALIQGPAQFRALVNLTVWSKGQNDDNVRTHAAQMLAKTAHLPDRSRTLVVRNEAISTLLSQILLEIPADHSDGDLTEASLEFVRFALSAIEGVAKLWCPRCMPYSRLVVPVRQAGTEATTGDYDGEDDDDDLETSQATARQCRRTVRTDSGNLSSIMQNQHGAYQSSSLPCTVTDRQCSAVLSVRSPASAMTAQPAVSNDEIALNGAVQQSASGTGELQPCIRCSRGLEYWRVDDDLQLSVGSPRARSSQGSTSPVTLPSSSPHFGAASPAGSHRLSLSYSELPVRPIRSQTLTDAALVRQKSSERRTPASHDTPPATSVSSTDTCRVARTISEPPPRPIGRAVSGVLRFVDPFGAFQTSGSINHRADKGETEFCHGAAESPTAERAARLLDAGAHAVLTSRFSVLTVVLRWMQAAAFPALTSSSQHGTAAVEKALAICASLAIYPHHHTLIVELGLHTLLDILLAPRPTSPPQWTYASQLALKILLRANLLTPLLAAGLLSHDVVPPPTLYDASRLQIRRPSAPSSLQTGVMHDCSLRLLRAWAAVARSGEMQVRQHMRFAIRVTRAWLSRDNTFWFYAKGGGSRRPPRVTNASANGTKTERRRSASSTRGSDALTSDNSTAVTDSAGSDPARLYSRQSARAAHRTAMDRAARSAGGQVSDLQSASEIWRRERLAHRPSTSLHSTPVASHHREYTASSRGEPASHGATMALYRAADLCDTDSEEEYQLGAERPAHRSRPTNWAAMGSVDDNQLASHVQAVIDAMFEPVQWKLDEWRRAELLGKAAPADVGDHEKWLHEDEVRSAHHLLYHASQSFALA